MKIIVMIALLLPFVLGAQGVLDEKYRLELVTELKAPPGYSLWPGQVSKDGAKYYMAFEDSTGNGMIHVLSVNATGKVRLKDSIEVKKSGDYDFVGQLSFTEDELQFVYTATVDNKETRNDLYLADADFDHKRTGKIRPLGELNDFETGESYPWISANGLRLYYINNDRIYCASKKSDDKVFKFPRLLSFDFEEKGVHSVWLTNDENELFYVSDNVVYRASRNVSDRSFSKPVVYTTFFKGKAFITAFCLGHKGKLAFVYTSQKNVPVIEIYRVGKK